MNDKRDYSGLERRQTKRYDFKHPIIQCRSGTRKFKSATIENISITGLLLLSPDNYKKGDQIDIKVSYVMLQEHRILTLKGKIVWSDEDYRHPGQQSRRWYTGVEFDEMGYEQIRDLENLIEHYCVQAEKEE